MYLNSLITDKTIVEVEEGGLGYNIKDSKEHEAGYDSFITGYCLIAMWKYLGKGVNNWAYSVLKHLFNF